MRIQLLLSWVEKIVQLKELNGFLEGKVPNFLLGPFMPHLYRLRLKRCGSYILTTSYDLVCLYGH